MLQSQIDYINAINKSTDDEILIKETGWEVIDLPEHLHDTHQIIHTLSGTIKIQIGDDSYFVPERHIAWISKGVAHTLSSNNRQISLRIINCRPLHGPEVKCTIFNSSRFIGENLRYIAEGHDIIRRSLQPQLFQFSISFLNLLPAMGAPYRTPLNPLKISDETQLHEILAYITAHLDRDMGLEDIARHFGISARSLSRMFHKSGIRYSYYLNYQRITRAIELFADGGRTLQEIAFEVGYHSPSHFNRIFRQLIGTSPTSFFSR